MIIQLMLVMLSLAHVIHAGDVCAPKLEGRINVASLGPRVFLEDNVLYFDRDRVDAPYYLNQFGTLFNDAGYPVAKIEGKRFVGGYGWKVFFDRHADSMYVANTGMTIKRVSGFDRVGVGLDGHICFDKVRCENLGMGFSIAHNRIYDPQGREVTRVTVDHPSGRCRYVHR